jgi:hypothetical protein
MRAVSMFIRTSQNAVFAFFSEFSIFKRKVKNTKRAGVRTPGGPLGQPLSKPSVLVFPANFQFRQKTDFSGNCDKFAIQGDRAMAQSVGSTAERSSRGMREAPRGLTKPSNKATKPYKPYKPEVAESNSALRP